MRMRMRLFETNLEFDASHVRPMLAAGIQSYCVSPTFGKIWTLPKLLGRY